MTQVRDERLLTIVADVVPKAYAEVATQPLWLDDSGTQMHRQQACASVSNSLLCHLLEAGPAKALAELGYVSAHRVGRRGATDPPVHSYLVLDTMADSGGEETIADPTWQQFHGRERGFTHLPAGAPKVLLGSHDEIVTYLSRLGASEALLDLYRPLEQTATISEEKHWGPHPEF